MRRTCVLLAVALSSCLAPGLSGAADKARTGPYAGPWFSAFGSWNTYAMSDVNSDIDRWNLRLSPAGLTMQEIGSDYSLGARAGWDRRTMGLGFGYERYFASSRTHDAYALIEFELPANGWYGFAEYRVPSKGLMDARLGASAGVVSLAPVAFIAVTDLGDYVRGSTTLTGRGPLLEGYASAAWPLSREFGVFASAGYRYAKVNEPKADGRKVKDYAVDYSGATLRMGLRLDVRK
jgi:hypothetical protein